MSHTTASEPHATPIWQGIPTTKFAMWLFLASEVMFFAGLIGAYIVLRSGAPEWPVVSEILNVPLVAGNTFILIVSSVTMVRAFAAIEDGNPQGMRRMLIATAALGTIFLSIQAVEWSALLSEGTSPSTSVFGSVFFTLTGFHGLHVLGGVLTLVVVIVNAFRGAFTQASHGGVELMGLYWHFVDVVWIFLFTILYLI
ncbi:MAG TPA: cytochrome c oxidase subunit 3 [Anaerolineae bacterium]|nr:cytochrome c oxidase subunit 3 [Anaerolineae bacterium]